MRNARTVAAIIATSAATTAIVSPLTAYAQPAPAQGDAREAAPAPTPTEGPAEPTRQAPAEPAETPPGDPPTAAPPPGEPATPPETAPAANDEPAATAPASPATRAAGSSAASVDATGGSATGDAGLGYGAWPEPQQDAEKLEKQGEERPEELDSGRIFAEDWWSHTRPALELHGYFRLRAELFHKFALGRIDSPSEAMWPRPSDDAYTDLSGNSWGPRLCTPSEAGSGSSSSAADATHGCSTNAQAGANIRFRVEPAIVISDNLRVRTQIDILDNLVLGSTGNGYSVTPSGSGYQVSQRNGYTPFSGADDTQVGPASGVNSLSDSITVKRAWAEYDTPVGQLRFGRMPDHWGLGIVHNAGDDLDADYQTTVDRIAFVTGIQSMSLYVGGAWDFASENPTSAGFTVPGGQPYDLGQTDDLNQYNLMVFRRVDPQLEPLYLSKGRVVMNGGLYLTYRTQQLANDFSGSGATCSSGAAAIDCSPGQASLGYARRGLNVWTPDLWFQVKYKKFSFDIEAATHLGTIESTAVDPDGNNFVNDEGGEDGWDVNQWGVATELAQLLVEDKLKLGFGFGWASGDPDVEGIVPGRDGMQAQLGDRDLQTFRFHPGYRVDLILNRHILNRVQGTYYFRPSVRYDFIRKATGLKLGGEAAAIWTRASQFLQAPGHEHDLGVELDATLYFQSSDGSLNDDPRKMGGFYSAIQYGVLFPMAGLGYQSDERRASGGLPPDLDTAQTVRWFLGVVY